MILLSCVRRALIAGACVLGISAPGAHAATLTVSNLNDSGAGSLRQAVLDANTNADADTITFDAVVRGTIVLTSGELPISQSVTLTGPGPKVLAVSGGGTSRLFNIASGTVAVSGLTLTGGSLVGVTGGIDQNGGEAQGGAILNAGVLSLTDVVLSQNSAKGGQGGQGRSSRGGGMPGGRGGDARGGAIYNVGTLSLSDTRLENNSAIGGQGGIGGSTGTRQGAGGAGGSAYGGAIFNANVLESRNVTFAGNTAVGGAGGTGRITGSAGIGENPDVRDVTPTAQDINAEGIQNRALSVQLKGAGDGTLTYSLVSGTLPDGLSLNGASGVISGALTRKSQSTKVTYKVNDGLRDSKVATVTFTIKPVEAQSLVVTTRADVTNDLDNLTSLREAIEYANTSAKPITIGFQLPEAGPYTFSLGNSPISVTGRVTLTTAKRGNLTLVAGSGGAFVSAKGATLNLLNLIIGGSTNADYTGIVNAGRLNISNCLLTGAGGSINNQSGTVNLSDSRLSGSGAGIQNGSRSESDESIVFNIRRSELSGVTNQDNPIFNAGTLSLSASTYSRNSGLSVNNGSMSISGCTFTDNSDLILNIEGNLKISGSTFRDNGGSLDNSRTMDISGCTLSGNSSYILLSNLATMRVSNCTLYGNAISSTYADASLIYNSGLLELDSCTITGNSVAPGGGGLFYNYYYVSEPHTTIRNCLVAENRAIEFGSDTALFEVVNSRIGGTAKAAGLQTDSAGNPILKNNGGATETVALVASSPAVGAGQTSLTTDQRGLSRPVGTGADIGAFELQSVSPPPAISVNSPSVREGNRGTTALTFTLTLSQTSKNTVSVLVNTLQGTAKAGSDYQSVPKATVTFAPGVTKQIFVVQVVGDTLVEPNERFQLSLRSPVNATLGTASGTGTIQNDDSAPKSPSLASSANDS